MTKKRDKRKALPLSWAFAEAINQSWSGTPRSVVPYGHGIFENPIEQGRILLMRYLRRHGYTIQEIADWLNEHGQFRRDGSEWTAGQVLHILDLHPDCSREQLPRDQEILKFFGLSSERNGNEK